ncbi:MAG: hypothetical protein JO325_15645 [Solirubrobacterales bacterium]|nr:hypothetical protein [Solirubrobacterales bacterium]
MCAGVVLAVTTLVVLFLIVSVRVLVAVSVVVVVLGGSVIVVESVFVIVCVVGVVVVVVVWAIAGIAQARSAPASNAIAAGSAYLRAGITDASVAVHDRTGNLVNMRQPGEACTTVLRIAGRAGSSVQQFDARDECHRDRGCSIGLGRPLP